MTAAAKAGGVTRQTVHRWQREKAAFQATLNRARNELAAAMETRLQKLSDRALGTVEDAVEHGNASVALAVLKGLGLLDGKRPALHFSVQLEEDPNELARRNERHERERELTRQQMENELCQRESWAGVPL